MPQKENKFTFPFKESKLRVDKETEHEHYFKTMPKRCLVSFFSWWYQNLLITVYAFHYYFLPHCLPGTPSMMFNRSTASRHLGLFPVVTEAFSLLSRSMVLTPGFLMRQFLSISSLQSIFIINEQFFFFIFFFCNYWDDQIFFFSLLIWWIILIDDIWITKSALSSQNKPYLVIM